MIERKRILITGASGFVGTNFLARLHGRAEFDLTAVYHSHRPQVLHDGVRYVHADLTDRTSCQEVCEGAEWVCHFAGKLSTTAVMATSPVGPLAENAAIHTNVLEAASRSGVEKLLLLSSTTGYPASSEPLSEEAFFGEDPPTPYEPVGWLSRFVEKVSEQYVRKASSPETVIALRPTSIYGPHDDFEFETCHALPAMIRRVVERHHPIEVWGSGEDGRDLLYVGDLVDACMLALERCNGFSAYNVGAGASSTINEILDLLIDLDGYSDAKVVHDLARSRHVSVRTFDCSRALNQLGFKASTSLEAGLRETLEWYRSSLLAA